jgi:Zn-dependent protease
LIAWTLATGLFPDQLRNQGDLTYWLMGAVAAIGLFVSVLIHELAHSLVALRLGLTVQSITLFIFGGVSQITSEAEEPRHEFLISVVGPVISFVLAGIFWVFFQAFGEARSPVTVILYYLALVNLLLGIFNLLPGFPLDGGRVLRSIVWGISGSLVQATNVASIVGQILAWLLIAWGVFQLFTGNLLGGLWTGLIGWFLNSGAEASRRQVVLRERFRRVPIAGLIRPDPPAIQPWLLVSELVYEYLVRRGLRALPVVDDGRVVGIVSITDVKELPSERWDQTPVASIMTRDPLFAVSPDATLPDVLELLDQRDVNQALVLQDGRLVGLLSRADVLRYIQIRDELGPQSLRAARR